MFKQTFKNIDDILRKEAGCASELDYTEQSSWLLFLKYLDTLEAELREVAKLIEAKTATCSMYWLTSHFQKPPLRDQKESNSIVTKF